MTFSVTMPALGESVSEGTVTRWLKAEGDHVNVDEPLLEVSTDKVDTEIPSPVAGTLQKIIVQIDQTVPVGAELAIIADGAVAAAPVAAAPVAAPVVATPAPVAAAPVAAPAPIQSAQQFFVEYLQQVMESLYQLCQLKLLEVAHQHLHDPLRLLTNE